MARMEDWSEIQGESENRLVFSPSRPTIFISENFNSRYRGLFKHDSGMWPILATPSVTTHLIGCAVSSYGLSIHWLPILPFGCLPNLDQSRGADIKAQATICAQYKIGVSLLKT
ncbi:hypothetical protein FRX31_008160 [Thalictrum thalictroides]|uniref:Uncharacterized protein n=1 Tax=Thalictrum thalictroides TaxID=46969 RepID=A0A7J6WYV0_THATH|nr:hypothetical protein FRX31_008160 [Thalictrum thalictroides]